MRGKSRVSVVVEWGGPSPRTERTSFTDGGRQNDSLTMLARTVLVVLCVYIGVIYVASIAVFPEAPRMESCLVFEEFSDVDAPSSAAPSIAQPFSEAHSEAQRFANANEGGGDDDPWSHRKAHSVPVYWGQLDDVLHTQFLYGKAWVAIADLTPTITLLSKKSKSRRAGHQQSLSISHHKDRSKGSGMREGKLYDGVGPRGAAALGEPTQREEALALHSPSSPQVPSSREKRGRGDRNGIKERRGHTSSTPSTVTTSHGTPRGASALSMGGSVRTHHGSKGDDGGLSVVHYDDENGDYDDGGLYFNEFGEDVDDVFVARFVQLLTSPSPPPISKGHHRNTNGKKSGNARKPSDGSTGVDEDDDGATRPVVIYLPTMAVAAFTARCLRNIAWTLSSVHGSTNNDMSMADDSINADYNNSSTGGTHSSVKRAYRARRRFVLVTGGRDNTASHSFFRTAWHSTVSLNDLLHHPLLKMWYGQNGDIRHDRFTCLPIGLDLHSAAQYSTHTFAMRATTQEAQILSILLGDVGGDTLLDLILSSSSSSSSSRPLAVATPSRTHVATALGNKAATNVADGDTGSDVAACNDTSRGGVVIDRKDEQNLSETAADVLSRRTSSLRPSLDSLSMQMQTENRRPGTVSVNHGWIEAVLREHEPSTSHTGDQTTVTGAESAHAVADDDSDGEVRAAGVLRWSTIQQLRSCEETLSEAKNTYTSQQPRDCDDGDHLVQHVYVLTEPLLRDDASRRFARTAARTVPNASMAYFYSRVATLQTAVSKGSDRTSARTLYVPLPTVLLALWSHHPRVPSRVSFASILHRRLRVVLSLTYRNAPWYRQPVMQHLFDHTSPLAAIVPRARHEVWRAMVDNAFIVSPPGVGYDCHRTWEALLLGCVPIVLHPESFAQHRHRETNLVHHRSGVKVVDVHSALSVFDDLPVIVVRDYVAEITVENLRRWRDEVYRNYTQGRYKLEKLFSQYWINSFYATD